MRARQIPPQTGTFSAFYMVEMITEFLPIASIFTFWRPRSCNPGMVHTFAMQFEPFVVMLTEEKKTISEMHELVDMLKVNSRPSMTEALIIPSGTFSSKTVLEPSPE